MAATLSIPKLNPRGILAVYREHRNGEWWVAFDLRLTILVIFAGTLGSFAGVCKCELSLPGDTAITRVHIHA